MSIINDLVLESLQLQKLKFIIHLHRADRVGLHYDIRLEKDNKLKSWACRKIPDLVSNIQNKILIIQQPDHELSWFDFSGEIIDGYGKGKVEIWDKGTYSEIKWTSNSIIVDFNGSKINGRFAMIPYNLRKSQWLMFRSKEQ